VEVKEGEEDKSGGGDGGEGRDDGRSWVVSRKLAGVGAQSRWPVLVRHPVPRSTRRSTGTNEEPNCTS